MNQNGPTSLEKKESTDLTQTEALKAKAQKYHAPASSDSPPKRYVFPTVCAVFESSSMMLSFYKKTRFKDFYREHIQPTFSIQTADPERKSQSHREKELHAGPLSVSKRSEQSSSEQIVFCFHKDSY